MKQNLAFVR